MPDNPQPLAQVADFQQTAFVDLAENLQEGELASILLQATRAVESETQRRLAPFTVTEMHRATAADPDEYGTGMSGIPLDLSGAIGMSYAQALGGTADQVRHFWLDQYAPQFQDMWGPYAITNVTILRSVGGSQTVQLAAGVEGPEADTGHVMLPLGTFCPIGSRVRITYTGGYSTVPQDLVAATVTWAASIIIRRLDPNMPGSAHDPGALRDEAIEHLIGYYRG